MPNTLTLGDMTIPFDEEIYGLYFEDEPDLMSDALIKSGVMVEDTYINSLIANGGDIFTIPFYGLLDYESAPDNYDGRTDISLDTISGSSQTGVVFGRAKGWAVRQFATDFTAANPMQAIAARNKNYWSNYKQRTMLSIIDAASQNTAMASHVLTLDALTETTLSDSAQEIFGDKKGCIGLAIMHSSVAQFYENKERVEYLKYTDSSGLTRELPIYEINGIAVVVYDGVGGTPATEGKAATYNTYLFARGSLRHGSAPVTNPVEVGRDALKFGGQDYLVNRMRETIHPNGFSFKKPTSGYTESPTDAQLTAKGNWSMAYSDARAIPIAKIVTPGVR